MPDTVALGRFCDDRAVAMTITYHGRYYQFRRGDTVVDWWPSSGKFIINKQWRRADSVQRTGKVIRRLDSIFPVVSIGEPAYISRLRDLDAVV